MLHTDDLVSQNTLASDRSDKIIRTNTSCFSRLRAMLSACRHRRELRLYEGERHDAEDGDDNGRRCLMMACRHSIKCRNLQMSEQVSDNLESSQRDSEKQSGGDFRDHPPRTDRFLGTWEARFCFSSLTATAPITTLLSFQRPHCPLWKRYHLTPFASRPRHHVQQSASDGFPSGCRQLADSPRPGTNLHPYPATPRTPKKLSSAPKASSMGSMASFSAIELVLPMFWSCCYLPGAVRIGRTEKV